MSGPYDPQQPHQWPPAGYQWYPPPGYGYPPAGPPPPPRRPGVLVAAGVLWLLNGAFLLVSGIVIAVADRMPGFEEAMRERNAQITSDQLITIGVTGAAFGAVIIALGVVVFSGATWARVLVMVVAVVPSALLLALVLFPLFTIAASVLQFLPPVTRYVQARRARAGA